MKVAMLGLALLAYMSASGIEHAARAAFPASLPPEKGGLQGPSALGWPFPQAPQGGGGGGGGSAGGGSGDAAAAAAEEAGGRSKDD